MSENMEDNKFEKLKRQVLSHGGYFVHFYFDMHGTQPEILQKIMVGFVDKLSKENGVQLAVGEIEEPIEHDGMHSTTARVSMLISDMPSLMRIAASYSPIAIEIEEPLEAKVSAGDLQNALMNVSAITQNLTQVILKRGLLTDEEKKNFEKQILFRAELGHRLMEGKSEFSKNKENEKKS